MTIETEIPTLSELRESTAPAQIEATSTRGFAVTYVLTFLTLVLAIMIINVKGNGAGLFPSKINPSVADRPWKTRRLAEQVKPGKRPKVMVLGSSRTMQIQPPYLAAITGKSVFNYGVSAAGPVDWLTQYRYLLHLGIKPELIIVGVDEFAFGDNANRYELQIACDWELFKRVPYPENLRIAKNIIGLVDLETTWTSITVLSDPPVRRQRNMKRVNNIMLADGYLIYRNKVAEKAEGKYDLQKEIHKQAANWKQNMNGKIDSIQILKPSDRKRELFEQFLDLAHSNGTEVRVIFLPLHPDYIKAVLTPEMLTLRSQLGLILKETCAHHNLVYRDFTSIESYGGSTDEFWDGAHQTPENLRRMINVLFDLPPEQVVKVVPTDEAILKKPPAVTTLNTW